MDFSSCYESANNISTNDSKIAGVDEAGRGALCGPVVSSAVILNWQNPIFGLNDSKKLTSKKRDNLFAEIYAKALFVSIGIVEPQKIDEINILNAALLSMKMAIDGLNEVPKLVLVDGNKRIPNLEIEQKTLVGGDAISCSIAAASIIAKVTRDRLMLIYHEQYPQYALASHKGYGTKKHYDAILKHGVTKIHRQSFNLSVQQSLWEILSPNPLP